MQLKTHNKNKLQTITPPWKLKIQAKAKQFYFKFKLNSLFNLQAHTSPSSSLSLIANLNLHKYRLTFILSTPTKKTTIKSRFLGILRRLRRSNQSKKRVFRLHKVKWTRVTVAAALLVSLMLYPLHKKLGIDEQRFSKLFDKVLSSVVASL